ncbi:helix-turn-helix domain-containing protein [Paenibacillus qinlingensis]|uniref:helix-turn-helix domain-containing protein n=1 Tax=Paenibacillus qinlingensis TaxID=1837343 RepID=UPI001565D95B|nr:helix-turn-helix domain-containing protein [Paenibacillus qinlingensis]NQX62208.1 helix-turn-helix domain-containing protein [Paenibacillus qinlingensis]
MSKTGIKIKNLRKEKKWTQKELADLASVSTQVISNWERGYSTPVLSDLRKLADLFRTSIDSLTGREEDIFSDDLNMADRIEILKGQDLPDDLFPSPVDHLSFDLEKLLMSRYSVTYNGYTLTNRERALLIQQISFVINAIRNTIDDLVYQAESVTETKLVWSNDTLTRQFGF